jgi:hypothetical protein
MKNILTFCVGIFCVVMVHAQFPEFELIEIGDAKNQLGQGQLIDIDSDGDLDWMIGSQESSIWFEYRGNDSWEKHTISDLSFTEYGATFFDIDGDNLIDMASGSAWYKNTGDPKEPFTMFENGAIIAYDNHFADIDGDGKNEMLAINALDGLYWYDIPAKPEKKWKKNKIDDGVRGALVPNAVGDMDCDGDLDIVRSNVWYENLNGDGSKWLIHRTISFGAKEGEVQNSTRTYLYDMDKDGDLDVIQTEANTENGRVAWHENKDCKGINFYTHWISSSEGTNQDCHTLCVADFDNDGDLDIFSGGGPKVEEYLQRLYFWEDVSGDGTEWKEHLVLERKESFEAVSGDIDGDGDIDICFKNWKGDKVYFLKNMLK